jgi:GntR family transcriptional regulator/MocR family aminotransferase
MARRATDAAFTIVPLEHGSPVPLTQQLEEGLRAGILTGRLAAGTRLPSTRQLARELGISRTTVLAAFAELLADGYVEGKHGSGTYVARVRPDDRASQRGGTASPAGLVGQEPGRRLARRGTVLAAAPRVPPGPPLAGPGLLHAFEPGLAALDLFPTALWTGLLARHWRRSGHALLAPAYPAGYRPLREAIAAYVAGARGIRCTPDHVVIVSGAQQGLDLAARVLLDPGDAAWIEDPGYIGARNALLGASARLVPVPVDAEGIDVAAGIARCATARLAYVTPAHQHPLGGQMSLERRVALLDWAHAYGAWVLEDDRDGIYRYAGRSLAALQGLDTSGQVLYVGTFSPVLFPALRLGYLIVPSDLVEAFIAARHATDLYAPTLEQAALADFITAGHLGQHVRRMRTLYAERQALLVDALRHELGTLLEIRPADAGMHLVGWLPDGLDDRAAVRYAALAGVKAVPLSLYALEPLWRGALLLGYAATDEDEMWDGVGRLARALRAMQSGA